jgi:uncharacterized repeat protein (TIGR02543 family)
VKVRRHSGALSRLLRLVLCSALILSLMPITAWAAPPTGQVVADSASSVATATANATSISFAHTTGSGSNSLMLVGISWNCGSTTRTVDAVRFTPAGGSPIDLTLVKKQQAGTQLRYAAIYSLLAPPAATVGTVSVTFSGAVSNGIVAGAVCFAGVDQVSTLGIAAGAGSPSQSTTPGVTLTGLVGDELVFDTVFMGASSAAQTLTPGSGQTQLWTGITSNTRSAVSTEQATGSSVTMSWTAASTGYWAIAAVPINPAAPVVTHQLSIDSSPTAGGTTTPPAGSHTYPEGEAVSISASPNPGYLFDYWSGDVTDPAAVTTTVTMDADKAVTANFVAEEYTLTAEVDGNGTVSKTPDQATYHYGDVVELNAVPDAGWVFTGWSGDLSSGLTPQALTITGDSTVTAHFAPYERAPLALDGAASAATGAAGVSSVSFRHSTGTGTDRLMLVGISWNCGTTDRTVAFATFTPEHGSPMPLAEEFTQLGVNASANPRYSAIYSLLDPPRNVTGTVTVTFSGTVSNGIVAGAANFAGVDQADPLGVPSGDTSTSGQAPTVTLTGLAGDEIVFDNVFQGASDSSQILTAGDGQTGLWNALVSNNRSASSIEQAAGDSVTMSWEAASAAVWAIAAVPINPVPPIDIAGATVAPIPDATYTGSAITPTVTVTMGTTTLVEGADYTVGYGDNTNVGTATVTITGIGDYAGTTSATFAIVKATPDVTWPSASAITLGQALSASGLTGGTHSVPGSFDFVDPTIVPSSAGTYTADVAFTPDDAANYHSVSGTVEVTVVEGTVENAEIPSITVQPSDVTVELGQPAELSITATVSRGTLSYAWYATGADVNSGGSLVSGDSSATFSPPTTVLGVTYYYCVVTNTDNAASGAKTAYIVSDAAKVEVEALDIADATVAPIPDQTYTGAAITPTVTVTMGPDTLVEDTDYTLSYANNTNVGTATVTITGIGDYDGTTDADFAIVKATPDVTWPSASAITLGQALSASLLTGGTNSVPGTFAFATPSFVPLVAGPYDALVTFTPSDSANYNSVSGTATVQVDPLPPTDIASATVAPISDKTYTGAAITPTVTVTLGLDTLVPGVDYTVGYANNTYAGKATVTVTGIGAYDGTATATFRIVPKKSAITKLTAGTHKFTASWKKHSHAGGYQVAYSRYKTKSFKYAPRTTKSSKTVTKLKTGVRYYVKVRAYKTIDGKRCYGKWSTVKSVKVK